MKKAIILAGGKGTRLSPLTDSVPKPLMPFLGKTLLERIIEKLAGAGVTDILISTMYRKDLIKSKIGHNLCGAHIEYLEETTPLGTAGGLVFAKDILRLEQGESFVVISGDCVCDFDLIKAKEFHKSTGAVATVITSECAEPLEYGIVLSKSGGLITSFSEKPCWSQVNGCRVNSGVYILDASVCDLVPKGHPYDFSKDLLPKMLSMGLALRECADDGYWCDIGNIESYYKCCIDALNGKISGFEEEKTTAAENGDIKITEPCYISRDAIIEKGAEIGPNVIISSGCKIAKNCEIAGSILHENVTVGENSRIEGAILCNTATIGKRCSINGGCVIGHSVKLSECSYIPSNTIVTSDISSKDTDKGNYFCHGKELCADENGIYLGLSENKEKESAISEKTGFAIGCAVERFGRIGFMYDGSENALEYYKKLRSGIEKSGRMSYDYGAGFEKLARHQCVFFGTECFVYVYENNTDKKIFAKLFNKNALPPSHDYERRLESCFRNADKQIKNPKPKHSAQMHGCAIYYYCDIISALKTYISQDGFTGVRLAFSSESENGEFGLLKSAFIELGGDIVDKNEAIEHSLPVIACKNTGEISVSQGNYTLDRYHIALAVIDEDKKKQKKSYALPYLFPESVVSKIGSFSSVFGYPLHSVKRFRIPEELLRSCYYLADDILLVARFISLLCARKKNISQYYFEQPLFSYREKTVYLPQGAVKTAVIKRLSNGECDYGGCDRYEGIKLSYPEGKVTVVPGKAHLFKIYSESRNAEIAESLCEQVEKKILDAANNKE